MKAEFASVADTEVIVRDEGKYTTPFPALDGVVDRSFASSMGS